MRKVWLVGSLAILYVFIGVAMSQAATGGPDGGGYSFIDNGSPGGPVFSFIDITGTGTPVTMPSSNHDDNVQANVPFGFTFNLYGTPYTVANLSTNGFYRFDGGTDDECCDDPGAIPTSDFNAPGIFGWWNDWDFGECGNIFYQTLGSAPSRKFVTEWDSCHNDSPTGNSACKATYEIVLFETTNHILFQYADTVYSPPIGSACDVGGTNDNDHGAHASVGIQQNSQVGLAYSIDGSRLLTDGLAICFFPAGGGAPCGAPPPPTSTPTATSTRQPTSVPPTERPRVNVGGAVGAVAAAAGEQARENRAAAAATPTAPAQVTAPNTGTGIASLPATGISPPNTGDAGLLDQAGPVLPALLLLVIFGFILASVAGFSVRRRP